MSVHKSGYDVVAGEYIIQVFARQAGDPAPARQHPWKQGRVLFELEPETQTYVGHASKQPEMPQEPAHG